MKHSELLTLLHKHSDTIDRAYREESVQNVEQELLDTTLFMKINDRYKLNKNYLNFVDSVLERVDYSIIFGDYAKEYKELVKLKKRYSETHNDFYKISIEKIIENLYVKFYNRDREIQILLVHLENETSLDIDILLYNASSVLEKIYELIDANEKVGQFFRYDLRGIDRNIDRLLQSISVDVLQYIQNIDGYIQQINRFIVQTKKRRLQSKNMLQVANMIVSEQCQNVDAFLQHASKKLYFTQSRSQKNKIQIFPDDTETQKLHKQLIIILSDVQVKPPKKIGSIKHQTQEKLDIINVDNIVQDLQNLKSKDVFKFVKEHQELSKLHENELINEAFKVYLYLTTKEEMQFLEEFNSYNIKVAQWV